jgi:predicted transcriptional regulator
MSLAATQSERIRAPYDYGAVANNFGVLKFTGGDIADTQNHQADAVPDDWQGQYVEIYVTGGDMTYAFSRSATAEVDRSVAASEAGASVKVGAIVPNGAVRYVIIPKVKADGTGNPSTDGVVYFVRESSAAGVVCYMRLASF